jgi:nitrogen fixation protein NifU and related proteins
MSDQLNELYRDVILDHYRDPRGRKEIDHPHVHNEGKNPSCGDEIEVDLKINDNVVNELGVHCAGCAISVASGSMLSEIIEGKSLSEVKEIAQKVKSMLKGEGELPDDELYEEIAILHGVKQFPVRIKCALLAWVTLLEGIESWEKGDKPEAHVSTEKD